MCKSYYSNLDYYNFNPIYEYQLYMPERLLLVSNNIKLNEKFMIFTMYNNDSQSNLHKLGLNLYSCDKRLQLLDIRYIKILLNELIKSINPDDLKNNELMNIINILNMSFGLSDFDNQLFTINTFFKNKNPRYKYINNIIKLLKNSLYKFYKIPIQYKFAKYRLDGFRFDYIPTDYISILVLKVIFEDICDGIIMPRLESPLYKNDGYYTNPEIYIFNPIKSGIYTIERPILIINNNFIKPNYTIEIDKTKKIVPRYKIKYDKIINKNNFIQNKKRYIANYDNIKRIIEQYFNKYIIITHDLIRPNCKINPWKNNIILF